MQFNPQSGFLGAEVEGLALNDLSSQETKELRHGLAEHQVLFFRNQPLSPHEQRDLGLKLGTLHTHPAYPVADGLPEVTILHHDESKPSKIDTWHTDMTFMAEPTQVSILQGLVIPERGGDTLFASCGAAWDHLSEPLQKFLAPLEAVHDFRFGFKESLAEPGGAERLADSVARFPPVRHPVMHKHPETGRPLLYVNRLFTSHIEGLSSMESQRILDMLFEHAAQPEFTARFSWEPHSIAIWDNRGTWHRPINDHGDRTRTMQRVTVRALHEL
jgi:taurine dioxygenase